MTDKYNDNCASATCLRQDPDGDPVAGSSHCKGRPRDFQPHLVTVRSLAMAWHCVGLFIKHLQRRNCLRTKKEYTENPNGEHLQIPARFKKPSTGQVSRISESGS